MNLNLKRKYNKKSLIFQGNAKLVVNVKDKHCLFKAFSCQYKCQLDEQFFALCPEFEYLIQINVRIKISNEVNEIYMMCINAISYSRLSA